MTTPNPPSSTHESTNSAAPKRHKHRRHAPKQTQPPEELPSPAPSGRASRSAPPPAGTPSTAPSARAAPSEAAPCAAASAEPTMGGTGSLAGQLACSSKQGRPALSARNAVPGKPVQSAVPLTSGDLGQYGRRDCIEGIGGLKEVLPGLANPELPGNGTFPNPARFRSASAQQVFGDLLERSPHVNSVWNVITEEGEVWEKGPEQVVNEGSSVRALYSPSAQAMHGADSTDKSFQVNSNARSSLQPGASGAPSLDPDAPSDEPGRRGSDPVRAGEEAGFLANHSRSVLSDCLPDSEQVLVGANRPPVGLNGSKSIQRQLDTPLYTAGGDGRVGGSTGSNQGRAKVANTCAKCNLSGSASHAFGHFQEAAEFASLEDCQRGQGELVAGMLGGKPGVVRGEGAASRSIAGPPNSPTPHMFPAAGLSASSQREDPSSAWDRPIGPWGRPLDTGRAGGWSPGYREAFPSIRGDDDLVNAQPHMEGGDILFNEDRAAPVKKVNLAQKQRRKTYCAHGLINHDLYVIATSY